MYTTPSLLIKPVGNNAFSYEERINKSLYIPSIINGDFKDIQEWTEIVFEDKNEKWILQSCTGLKNFVRMKWNNIPMNVFDNHNHALYFWYEARINGLISTKNTLVHIDEHSDLWKNKNDVPWEWKLPEIFDFVNEQCNVGNYIQPTLWEGIIEKILRIEDTIGLEKYGQYQKWDGECIILNLDLDFFARELDYIPFEDKKKVILHFAHQANFITVATSPFFIDQERAIEMLGKVFGFMEE